MHFVLYCVCMKNSGLLLFTLDASTVNGSTTKVQRTKVVSIYCMYLYMYNIEPWTRSVGLRENNTIIPTTVLVGHSAGFSQWDVVAVHEASCYWFSFVTGLSRLPSNELCLRCFRRFILDRSLSNTSPERSADTKSSNSPPSSSCALAFLVLCSLSLFSWKPRQRHFFLLYFYPRMRRSSDSVSVYGHWESRWKCI